MSFRGIQVDVLTSDVMAGAGAGAGPAQDVRHQPEGTACRERLSQWINTLHCPFQLPMSSRWWHSGIECRLVCMRVLGSIPNVMHIYHFSFFAYIQICTSMYQVCLCTYQHVPGLFLYILIRDFTV